jgi:Ca-activated chloride channel family protein
MPAPQNQESMMPKFLKRLTIAVAVAAIGIPLGITLWGDNARRLFAMSADSLAGNGNVAVANTIGAVSSDNLNKKKMANFGLATSYGEGSSTGNSYAPVAPNKWTSAHEDRLSTFAIDVDTASYTLARRALNDGNLPDKDGVRIEEWVNAFAYELEAPTDLPFSVNVEGSPSPFTPGRTLLKVALQGRKVRNADRKPAHLVFLVDTSGSMGGPDRLGLAQESLRILTEHLNPRDTVALVTYAGNVSDVLPPTPAENKATILAAIDSLSSGGGTAMGSGLEIAYRHAGAMLAPGHVSRVIVLTDGDANIGNTSAPEMLASVAGYVKRGVTLTTVGFGMGNYHDGTLEQLADKGNGQSLYIDSKAEAERVFSTNVAGTLELIAKDVKVQVAFDSKVVQEYRLLGYENRAVADKDFRDDTVAGGVIGAGHSVTALYELTLAPGAKGSFGDVFVRGMKPEQSEAFEVKTPMAAAAVKATLAEASTELRFAAAVAISADILRGNPAASDWSLAKAQQLAKGATRGLAEREELVKLLERAQALNRTSVAAGGAR